MRETKIKIPWRLKKMIIDINTIKTWLTYGEEVENVQSHSQ